MVYISFFFIAKAGNYATREIFEDVWREISPEPRHEGGQCHEQKTRGKRDKLKMLPRITQPPQVCGGLNHVNSRDGCKTAAGAEKSHITRACACVALLYDVLITMSAARGCIIPIT